MLTRWCTKYLVEGKFLLHVFYAPSEMYLSKQFECDRNILIFVCAHNFCFLQRLRLVLCYEFRLSFQLLFLLNLAVKYHSNCHTGSSQYFRLQYFGDQLECKDISTVLFVREILPILPMTSLSEPGQCEFTRD